MTYETFKRLAMEHRTDITYIGKHGSATTGKSKYTLAIVFRKPNGTESTVYSYSGTYAEVLDRLGIGTYTEETVINYQMDIDRLKKTITERKASLFSRDPIEVQMEKAQKRLDKLEADLQKIKDTCIYID